MRDPELTRLLLQELHRHLGDLRARTGGGDASSLESARRVAHALKGSAGLAGEPELAAVMQRLERRFGAGDTDALADAATSIEAAIARLEAGERAVANEWPVPPADLLVPPIDPLVRTQYLAEISDRLAQIDEALADRTSTSTDVALVLYRHVHTMKGAASAVSDEPMAWFCHGLEERLRGGHVNADGAARAIAEVTSHRAILGTLLEDPEAALASLRGAPLPTQGRASATPGRRGTSGTNAPDDGRRDSFRDDLRSTDDQTVRVGAASIDRLIDHLGSISLIRERMAVRLLRTGAHAKALRRLRNDLVEALRLIGPPRPWGAPAAALRRIERTAQTLADLGDRSDVSAIELETGNQSLKEHTTTARRLVASMRQTPIRGMFARVEAAALSEARRTGRLVTIRTTGGEESIDRRLAERLVEPCLQLARNAIAHGIESPEAREALGKPPMATLTFGARRLGSRLVITIEDDGAGVDVKAVRARAVESGIVTEALAEAADDQTLLELLFVPGFSTRAQSPDVLAGRGVGLDITLASVQKLGGTIRLSSRLGGGFLARLDVPIESGLAKVLWVTAAGSHYAVPAVHVRAIRTNDGADADRVPHLAACLEPGSSTRAPYVIDVDVDLDAREPFTVGVDAVDAPEEVLVRELSPILRGMGPFGGAVVRGDGALSLAIDVPALAPRVRALVLIPESRLSERPSGPRSSR